MLAPSSNVGLAAAPAADLVAAAMDASRLDELENIVGPVATAGREPAALAVLIAVAR